MFSLFNFFRGSADPICPYIQTPISTLLMKYVLNRYLEGIWLDPGSVPFMGISQRKQQLKKNPQGFVKSCKGFWIINLDLKKQCLQAGIPAL